MAKRKGGKLGPRSEKLHLKPLRRIEIYPEAGTSAESVPCCYEYQVETGKTRAFLRTTSRYSAVPARVLAALGNLSPGPLLSVDDGVWHKQASRRFSKELTERYRSPSFFRRNLWWLLALCLLLFGDFIHVAERGSLAAWLTPPYALTGGLLFALWAWCHWPQSWRRKPRNLSAKIEALGESIPLADNRPGMSFGQPDTRAAQRLALDFAEGQVSQVSYTYFNIPSDESDLSVVVLNFSLIRTDGSVLSCRHEVRKCDALFFVGENDIVRLLGEIKAGKMVVEQAVNLADGHIYSDFSLISLSPQLSASKSHWQFSFWIISEATAIAGIVIAAFLVLGFAALWCTGLLMGVNPSFFEMLGQLAYFSAAALFLALIFGGGQGLRRASRARRIASALGLQRPGELISRQRVVCNQSYCNW